MDATHHETWKAVCATVFMLGCLFVNRREVSAECTTSICVGDPCTITGTHQIALGCDLNFGTQRVTIDSDARVISGAQSGFSMEAQDLTVAGTLGGVASDIKIHTTHAFSVANTGTVDIRGNSTGFSRFQVHSDGAVTVNGLIKGNGLTLGTSGANVILTAGPTGTITIGGFVRVHGTAGGNDGTVTIGPACAVNITNQIIADAGFFSGSPGALGGGTITVEYRGNLTCATAALIASDSNTIRCRCAMLNGSCLLQPFACEHPPSCAGNAPPENVVPEMLGPCQGCPNGVLEPSLGEECDDGNFSQGTPGDTCHNDCKQARCGDGVRDPGEVCDDGGGVCCSSDCQHSAPDNTACPDSAECTYAEFCFAGQCHRACNVGATCLAVCGPGFHCAGTFSGDCVCH